MSFCSNCGNKVKEGTKFCSKCGASLSNESESINNQHNTNLKIPCPKCSSLIPVGNIACTNCGSLLNPEKHIAAIVLGYICSICLPVIGIIFGIYLLTRNNNDVHKHGIIMIVLAIIMMLIIRFFWFSYMSYVDSMSYYNNYYYY